MAHPALCIYPKMNALFIIDLEMSYIAKCYIYNIPCGEHACHMILAQRQSFLAVVSVTFDKNNCYMRFDQ